MLRVVISNINISSRLLKNLKEFPDKFYRRNDQPKIKFGCCQLDKNGAGKMRIVFEPVAILKVIQQQINYYIQKIPLPSCMHGGIRNRDNISNAYEHVGSKFFLTVDLKSFFTNISHKRINHTLLSYGFSWEEARIITRLCTLNGSLPQGAPTSTALANLVFAATALELETMCIEKNIIFTNFVDDLTFSSCKDFEYFIPQILCLLKKNGFVINHKKIHYRRDSCEITGLLAKNRKLQLEETMMQRLENPQVKAYANRVYKYPNAS